MAEKKESVVSQLYREFKRQIITSRMVPGQLLMAQKLAQDFGVSRTPVREALIRLKEEGLVEDAGGHKFKVSALSWKMVEDSYHAREIIEGECIAYAAKNATKEQIAVLEKLCKEMSKVNNEAKYDAYFALDQDFHYEIVKIMDNDRITDFMSKNADEMQRIRYYTRSLKHNIEVSYHEHVEMTEAIKARNPVLAKKLISKHLRRVVNDLRDLKEEEKIYPLTLIS
ncbi:MAG: GntR family transcriptional regulator [Erysipelotrichaceae bacterium]|nr:GntR family transcriptional regulator [Erysipelotrichaceae bacterium]